ncbi:MAG: SpoIIE family protein phosphatase [Acidimicrobiia bacterium]
MPRATGDLRRFLDTYRQVAASLFEPQSRLGVAGAMVGPVRLALGADRAVVYGPPMLPAAEADVLPTGPGGAAPAAATDAAAALVPLVGEPASGPASTEPALVAAAHRQRRVAGPLPEPGGEELVAIPLADGHGPIGVAVFAFAPDGEGPLEPSWFDALELECREAMERGRLWEVKAGLRERTRQDQVRLEASERRLRRVLDGLFLFVGLLSPDGTLLEANRAALDAGGLEPGDVVGKPFWDTYWWAWDEGVQAELRAAVARAAAGRPSRYDVQVRLGGGRLITIDFQLVPVPDDDGRITYLVPSGLDITDRKRQEAELEQRLRDEQRAREQAEALQQLAEALGAASSSDDVYDAVVHSAAAVVGAAFANLAVPTEDDTVIALRNGPGLPGDIAARWTTVPVDTATPLGMALRTAATVWAADPVAIAERFPTGAADADAAGLRALGAVPVVGAGGRVVAVIGLAWHEPRPLTPELQAALAALAAVVGQAVERAGRFDAERHVAQALQAVLLPAGLPQLGTMELTARYLAAESTLAVGGDWYECFTIDAGRVVLALGDVVGRGLEAAATVGQLRAAVAALANSVPGPGALLDRLDGFVRHFPGAICTTVVCVELAIDTGELRYACAGHPPPLLVRADGSTVMLEGGRSTPIGISAGPRPEATARLEPGERLVLYTDGLVERRGERIDVGFDRLRAAATANAGHREAAFLDGILAATVPQAAGDDVCVLAVHRHHARQRLAVSVREGAPGLAAARHGLRGWLEELGADPATVDEVVLAAGEAMGNAVEHAYLADPTPGDVLLEATMMGGVLELTVSDFGAWRREAAPGPRGRGLGLMRLVMDEVRLEPSPSGTKVTMRRSMEVQG